MKPIFSLLLVFALLSSCKKDHDCHDSTSVKGEWEWYKATGGIAGVTMTPQSTNSTWTLRLGADHSALQTGTFRSPDSGTYVLTTESGGEYLTITFSNSTEKFRYTFISPDSIRLDDHIEADGLSYFLVRR